MQESGRWCLLVQEGDRWCRKAVAGTGKRCCRKVTGAGLVAAGAELVSAGAELLTASTGKRLLL